jgi:uncharacterized Ntn-hydrolase superfamily protein
MTFSLLGRCARTGRMGMVVSSSSPAVAARCAHVRPGVGVAGSQNITDPRLGPALLDELERGAWAQEALDEVVAQAPHAEFRQLVVLDAQGRAAARSGAQTLGIHGERVGVDCAAAGNLLSREAVLDAMVQAFGEAADEALGPRLLGALRAGAAAGGEAGPVHSAGLVMTGDVPWPIADLRVDWHDDPIGQLDALWRVYAPQLEDYVTRALDPRAAPGYGVPGE